MEATMAKPMTAGDYDALLQEVSAEYKGGDKEGPSLAAMLGDCRPVSEVLGEGYAGLFFKPPKLRERLEMMRIHEKGIGKAEPSGTEIIEYLVRVIAPCMRVIREGKTVTASVDDLLDNLDSEEEVQKLTDHLLRTKGDEKGGGPSGPITDGSSGP